MSKYKKLAKVGATTILLPLATRALKKLVSKHAKKSKTCCTVEERDDFLPAPAADQQESL